MNCEHINSFPSKRHYYLTKEGLDELKIKLDQLRYERFSIYKRLRKMDNKEKVEHIITNDVIELLAINEENVMKISDVLNHAEPVIKNVDQSDVKIGSTVNLLLGNQTYQYTLVSTIEANPLEHKISENSPLGMALFGKKEQELINMVTPKGEKRQYKVLSIA